MAASKVQGAELPGLMRAAARLRELSRHNVLVGIPKGKEHGDGLTTAQVGAWMEFGVPSRNIPERPWLRTGVARALPLVERINKVNVPRILDGRMAVGMALDLIGVAAVGEIKKTIAAGPWAPNAPATIARKGSDKPLIDTAQMLSDVSHVVEGAV